MTRPLVIAVLGTGTEVGKTWATVRLAAIMRVRGRRVVARKPTQSFEAGSAEPTDRDLLADATGEAVDLVCPPHRCYPVAMAPPMAADSLGREAIAVADLLAETSWPSAADLVLVETAGGAASPIAHDATSADLAIRLAPDRALLVADAGLGTIHAVTTTLPVLAGLTVSVLLNRFDPSAELHRRNHAWLEQQGVSTMVALDTVADELDQLIS